MMSLRKFEPWKTAQISSTEDLKQFFSQQIQNLPARTVFLFQGEVGVGKTESVKKLAEILGLGQVASPSFAIHHRYQNSTNSLDHVDLYRLNDEDDLESTGFWDLFQQDRALLVIEWPERINLDWIPGDWNVCEYHFSFVDVQMRSIRYRKEQN